MRTVQIRCAAVTALATATIHRATAWTYGHAEAVEARRREDDDQPLGALEEADVRGVPEALGAGLGVGHDGAADQAGDVTPASTGWSPSPANHHSRAANTQMSATRSIVESRKAPHALDRPGQAGHGAVERVGEDEQRDDDACRRRTSRADRTPAPPALTPTVPITVMTSGEMPSLRSRRAMGVKSG